jgi:rhamnogalacturonan endolyase
MMIANNVYRRRILPLMKHLRRGLCLTGLIGALGLRFAVADDSAGDVQVSEDDSTITLKNGLAEAVIDKKKAQVSSISLTGEPNLVGRGGVSFDAEAFGVGKNEAGISGEHNDIVSRGPDIAEVKFVDSNFIHFLTAEMHIVMKKGVPGVYEYLVLKHGSGQPAGSVGQLRWVFRGDGSMLPHAFASATKQGAMVPNEAFTGAQAIADATFRLTSDVAQNVYKEPMGHTQNGDSVYSKYDWADYAENHCVHGFSSETDGIFMVQPSMEYYNGGPSKGILTVHNGPVSILEFLGGHFLIRNNISVHVTDDQEWQQIVGPWLVYVNKGANADALWKDAFERGLTEKAAWPYDWVKEDEALYPHSRGTLTGTLSVPNQKAANALLVLAQPDGDWQTQTMGYEFWTRADAGGHFSLPKVRPGTYALYASVPGVEGEAKITDIKIEAGKTNDLGTIQWTPPSRQKLLWRVGTPDRNTAEFKYGKEPRQFGLWWRYLKDQGTQDVNFTIGQSDPAKDWYYAQSVLPMTDGSYFSPTWNILFDVADVPTTGPMLLTVDLAGAAGENNLHVIVNDHEVGPIAFKNDSGIYRSAVQSADFRHNEIQFDSSLLKKGANKISFSLDAKHNWKQGGADAVITTDTSSMPEIPSSGVMYDCIQLEAGPVAGDGSYKIVPGAGTSGNP